MSGTNRGMRSTGLVLLGIGSGPPRSAPASDRLRAAHAAGHDLVLEQAALQRAVVERRALGHLQLDQLWQIHVGAENVAVPTGEFLFQRIAEFGIELGQFLLLAQDRKSTRLNSSHLGI